MLRIVRNLRRSLIALMVPLAGCGGADKDQSLDGGYRLSPRHEDAEGERILANDPCWRREREGWHYSIGHCREILPPRRVHGVFVTGFEERSFFPGASSLPDRNDPRRFRIELEVALERIRGLTDRKLRPPAYYGVELTLIARRTRYPIAIDCYGGRSYVFVADRVESAHYLGPIANPDFPSPGRGRYKPFQPSGEGGVIGRMEAQALKQCAGKG